MKTYYLGITSLLLMLYLTNNLQAQIDADIEDLTIGCISDLDKIPAPDVRLVQIRKSCRNPQIKHTKDLIAPGNCASSKILHRTYQITDDCRNTSTVIQKISFIFEDQVPHDIDITLFLGCNPEFPGAIPDPNDFTPPGCGEKFDWIVDEKGNEGCSYWLVRRYKVFTECGHSYIYSIHYAWMVDLVPPHIKCPPDIDLGCNPVAIPAPDPSLVKAEDMCCDPTVSWLTDVIISNPGDCHQERIRKYIAEDCCGNQAICEQRISWISDLTAPTIIDCPDDKHLGCNFKFNSVDDLPKPTPEEVKVTDDCSEVKIQIAYSDITVFGCEFSITRTYIAYDACGNEAQCFQTFTWTADEIPPVIVKCAQDIDLGCNPEITDLGLQSPDYGIVATDNCGIKKISMSGTSPVYAEGCQKYYWIEYTVTDYCGNQSRCKQKVSWTEDYEPPVINCPPNVYYCTPHHTPPVDLDLVYATDNCGIDQIALTASSISLVDGISILTRTFTATDFCGNESSCDQTIVFSEGFSSGPDILPVYDTLPVDDPIDICFLFPEDVQFGCVTEFPKIPQPDLDFVISPGCEEFKISHLGDDMQQINPCEYVLTRSYQMIDCCRNETVCYQQFKWRMVDDTTTVIPFPEDQIAFCEVPPVPDFAYQCGKYIPIYLGQTVEGDCNNGACMIKRHWKSAVCGGVQLLHDQIIELKCDITFGNKTNLDSNVKISESISIFPNPARDQIHLDLSGQKNIRSIRIINVTGQVIKAINTGIENQERFKINIEELQPGPYILQIKSDNSSTEKFIKLQ